jgi:hypothetical protein
LMKPCCCRCCWRRVPGASRAISVHRDTQNVIESAMRGSVSTSPTAAPTVKIAINSQHK